MVNGALVMKLFMQVIVLLPGTASCQHHINIIPISYTIISVSGNGEQVMELLVEVTAVLLGAQYVQQLPKKVKFSDTRYRALGPELIPVYRQSARR